MGEGREHQRKPVLNKFELIFALSSGLLDIIHFFREEGVPLSIFSFIFTVLLGIFFFKIVVIVHVLYEEWQIYVDKDRKLYEKAAKKKKRRKKYGYKKEACEREFRKNCKDKIKEKHLMPVFIIFSAIIVMSICNRQNAYAYFSGLKDVISGATAENEEKELEDVSADKTPEEENETESKEETADEEERIDALEQAGKERDMRWRFVLDKPDAIFLTDSARVNQVFFYGDESLEEYVPEKKKQWENVNRKSVAYKQIKDSNGNTFDIYTAQEDTFKEKVEKAAQYIYEEEWCEHAPHSSEYDKCISGREELNQVVMGGRKGSYRVWMLLANDYLYFAQEYEMQTENVEAVSYYYINSTYCCMEALQYAATKEEYDKAFSFLTMRYHDICRDECIMLPEEKKRAAEIYSLLVSDIE